MAIFTEFCEIGFDLFEFLRVCRSELAEDARSANEWATESSRVCRVSHNSLDVCKLLRYSRISGEQYREMLLAALEARFL